MEIEIDPEELIPLIRERSVIWDKTSADYNNKSLKQAAWREIYDTLIPDFEKLEEYEKQHLGKAVTSKWTNLRDSWMRANKNKKTKLSKPYVYKKQMKFLNKIAKHRMRRTSESDMAMDEEVSEEDYTPPRPNIVHTKIVRHHRDEDMDQKISQFLDSSSMEQAEPPMLSFFRGVLPSLIHFDEDEMLEFQSGVIALIQQIKRNRNNILD